MKQFVWVLLVLAVAGCNREDARKAELERNLAESAARDKQSIQNIIDKLGESQSAVTATKGEYQPKPLTAAQKKAMGF